jgi:hypothetical protein
LELLAKSRPRSDIFLCSIKEGTGYELCGALQNSVHDNPLADKKSFKWPMVLEANSSYVLSSMKPEKQNKIYQYGKSSQI